jgi:dUTP pyrophosphatase
MQRIAKFEKVSFDQFRKDWAKYDPAAGEADVRKIYDALKLPQRATKGSAGYDFYAPVTIAMEAGKERLIPTGIRVKISDGFVLVLVPRSSLGFKFRMQLDNTVGVIDADYYGSDNEGHIHTKFTCDARQDKVIELEAGDAFMQAIFLPYGLTDDDDVTDVRNGGFGSTD